MAVFRKRKSFDCPREQLFDWHGRYGAIGRLVDDDVGGGDIEFRHQFEAGLAAHQGAGAGHARPLAPP